MRGTEEGVSLVGEQDQQKKRKRRLERNRLSASAARSRKKVELEAIETTRALLRQKHAALRHTEKGLEVTLRLSLSGTSRSK